MRSSEENLSFGNSMKDFSAVQQVLIFALMLISALALFYFEMSIIYKIGIVVLVFSVLILTSIAVQIMRQIKESRKT